MLKDVEKLKEVAKKDYGYTQANLARELDVQNKAVWRWFHNLNDPTAENLIKIRKFLAERDELPEDE